MLDKYILYFQILYCILKVIHVLKKVNKVMFIKETPYVITLIVTVSIKIFF